MSLKKVQKLFLGHSFNVSPNLLVNLFQLEVNKMCEPCRINQPISSEINSANELENSSLTTQWVTRIVFSDKESVRNDIEMFSGDMFLVKVGGD